MIVLLTAQQLAFWVLAPIAVLGAMGMVVSRKPVHSAISLAGMMVALGCLYASLDAPFLFVAQIIVYTGAIMMLFLFTMMIIGVDSVDSLVETIKGHRVLSVVATGALAAALIVLVGNGITTGDGDLELANSAGNAQGLAAKIFDDYVSAFLGTAALLIVATLAAIVLSHGEPLKKRTTQKELARMRTEQFMDSGANPAPRPGPGVYARHNSIEYPGLRPDGTPEETSVSPTLSIRGSAVVTNDGLRAAHAAAIGRFLEVHDELDGTDRVAQVDQEMTDPQATPTGKITAKRSSGPDTAETQEDDR